MSLHINRFIDRLKAADARHQREFIMSISDARDLHADITKLLLIVQNLQESKPVDNEVVTVNLDGGSF